MRGYPTKEELVQLGPVRSVPKPGELEAAARQNRENAKRKLFELRGLAALAENADLMAFIEGRRNQAILALVQAENPAARGLAQAWASISSELRTATKQAMELEAKLEKVSKI